MPAPGPSHQTPLAAELKRLIKLNGPISVADYMSACLSDPKHGYYARKDPLGPSGDFITAPEISQIFGELIGVWCVGVWESMGSPSSFVLAELGPGRGTLMADAIRASRIRPAFLESATIAMVEINEDLRRAQAASLRGYTSPTWVDHISDLPPGPLIVIANEFFDALPIRQFVKTEDGWAERMVGFDDTGALSFGLRRLPDAAEDRTDAGIGAVREDCASAKTIVKQLAERIAADGGAALIVDYGYRQPGFGDTLQALRQHQYDDPLAHPGEADLTAHVDFASLSAVASDNGAVVGPILDQATFLSRMEIEARAAMLAKSAGEDTRGAIATAVRRLTAPEEMGSQFKAMAFASHGVSLPAFDGVT